MEHGRQMTHAITAGGPDDLAAILALLPRLAAFDLPPGREARDLWAGDADLVRRWARGEQDDCFALVAGEGPALDGVAVVRLQPEPLSHAPGAHLEVLAVAAAAEGRGLGAALLEAAQAEAAARGARSMTLHVFAVNARARRLYERAGFTGEIIRYIKDI
ncbi:MAG: GNAT family N-acetyltransferase [Vicinamibacterales bacterium]